MRQEKANRAKALATHYEELAKSAGNRNQLPESTATVSGHRLTGMPRKTKR